MKLQFFTLTLLLAGLTFNAHAQLKPSSEPRPQLDIHTGETIILPTFLKNDAPKVAPHAPKKERIVLAARNVAQTRSRKIEKLQNGFYSMAAHSDWGTSVRLNSYGYSRTSL